MAAPLLIRASEDRLSDKRCPLQPSVKVHRRPELAASGRNPACVQFLGDVRQSAAALDHKIGQEPHHCCFCRIDFESRPESAFACDSVAVGGRAAWPAPVKRLELPPRLGTGDDSAVVRLDCLRQPVDGEPSFMAGLAQGLVQGLDTALDPSTGVFDLPDAAPDSGLRSSQTVKTVNENDTHPAFADFHEQFVEPRSRVRRPRFTEVFPATRKPPRRLLLHEHTNGFGLNRNPVPPLRDWPDPRVLAHRWGHSMNNKNVRSSHLHRGCDSGPSPVWTTRAKGPNRTHTKK